MLSKTYQALEDLFDYQKNRDGSWTIEFRGPFSVHVTEATLDRCRYRAFEELDDHLTTWLSKAVAPKQRVARVMLKAAARIGGPARRSRANVKGR